MMIPFVHSILNPTFTLHPRSGTSTCGRITTIWTEIKKIIFLVSMYDQLLLSFIEFVRLRSRFMCAEHFNAIGHGEWQWLIIVAVFTIFPSLLFILIELFRETKADGSSTAKSNTEVFIEGICFLTLVLAWIPIVMVATTPKGAASLIGNAYFFTWLMTIVVFEGFIWFIHDKRTETHYALKEKEEEYHRLQRGVLEQTTSIQ